MPCAIYDEYFKNTLHQILRPWNADSDTNIYGIVLIFAFQIKYQNPFRSPTKCIVEHNNILCNWFKWLSLKTKKICKFSISNWNSSKSFTALFVLIFSAAIRKLFSIEFTWHYLYCKMKITAFYFTWIYLYHTYTHSNKFNKLCLSLPTPSNNRDIKLFHVIVVCVVEKNENIFYHRTCGNKKKTQNSWIIYEISLIVVCVCVLFFPITLVLSHTPLPKILSCFMLTLKKNTNYQHITCNLNGILTHANRCNLM